MPDATTPSARPLLPELFALVAAHRAAFGQERPYQRSLALVLGGICAFGRHTVTQLLLALGLGTADWTAFYRLFSKPRFDYERLCGCLLGQTLELAPVAEPYLVGLDGTQLPRHSRTLPGTTWLRHLGTAVFAAELHRAQRFSHLAWLPLPSGAGFSRAVALRFDPAFPAKAVPAVGHPPQKEWEAGLAALTWLRAGLDAAERGQQPVLALGDGQYSTAKVWAALPERVTMLARCAKNRALYALPSEQEQPRRGRRRVYGDRLPRPDAWLAVRGGWQRRDLRVRGRTIPVTYRVEGPSLVRGAPEQPLFLLVVKGSDPRRGRKKRPATCWLVSAVAAAEGGWRLPWPAAELLAWAWQRWELEVAHRELKTGFGLGETQCWSAHGAIRSVQWMAWAYAVCVLAGIRAWGVGRGPVPPPGRWWRGSGRWSLARLWQGYRQELWGERAFHRVCVGFPANWHEMSDWLTLRTNATLAASRT
jgi:hypothetical protein